MRKHSTDLNNREDSPYDQKKYSISISRTNSKNSLTSPGLPPKTRHFKSPSLTPSSSPMLTSPEYEDFSTTASELKEKDQVYYLRQKIMIQEKRIHLLEEENKRLSSIKTSEFWEKELVKRNDEMRKLESKLRYYIDLNHHNTFEDKSMDLIIEKDKRIEQLELQVGEGLKRVKSLENSLQKVENEFKKNMESSNKLMKKEELEVLMQQIQELEVSLEYHSQVNKELKEQNEKLTQETRTGSLAYFSQDIHKIRREMNKLAALMKDFINGKEITLKSLLGLDPDAKLEPLKQIAQDIQCIKIDLSTVLGLIADIHADQYSNVVCRNQ